MSMGDVVQAFLAGTKKKCGNASTDGETYWLFSNAIAKRCTATELEQIIHRLETGEKLVKLQYSYAGWSTKTTRRHLGALGLDTYQHKNEPYMNGKQVSVNGWYSLEELEKLPHDPLPVPRMKFVNLTAPLFA